jgi:hypothetical protein
VIASFEGSEDERLRTLAQSLARHLHAFATEVGLTQREWEEGVRILTETGDITDDRRQEFILWSDTLGLSMVVDALANPFPPGGDGVDGPRPLLRPRSAAAALRGVDRRGSRGDARVDPRPCARPERRADRRSRARRMAERRRPALRRPEPGGARGPPPRQVHLAPGRQLRVPRRATRSVPDPGRRPRREDARRDRPSSVAAGTRPHDRPRARLPDAGHAHLRPRERVPRLRRGVRRQAVAPSEFVPRGPTTRSAPTESRGSGSRSRTRSCSCRPRSPASRSIPAGRRRSNDSGAAGHEGCDDGEREPEAVRCAVAPTSGDSHSDCHCWKRPSG